MGKENFLRNACAKITDIFDVRGGNFEKLIYFFMMMMEELPGEILGEILRWLTPIEISRLGVINRVVLKMVLKLLNVRNVFQYIDRWRCDGCASIFPTVQLGSAKTARCKHVIRKYCTRCVRRDWKLAICYKCRSSGLIKVCTRCRHHDDKLVESICPHGWIKRLCSRLPCEYYCKACGHFTLDPMLQSGGFLCDCGKYNAKEDYPDCMCEENSLLQEGIGPYVGPFGPSTGEK
jgi:hypothetical protein